MIEFGSDNDECKKYPPYIVSCKEAIGADEPSNTLIIEIELGCGSFYKIIFEDYMLHLTRNESYTAWDEYDIRKGLHFIIFERSRLLDMLDTLILHTVDHSWPGIGRHFGIYTFEHIIDVISANDPIIKKIK